MAEEKKVGFWNKQVTFKRLTLAGVLAGMMGIGAFVGYNDNDPINFKIADFDGDGRTDIAIKTIRGVSIYLKQEDGSYKSLEDVKSARENLFEKKIDSWYKQARKEANF